MIPASSHFPNKNIVWLITNKKWWGIKPHDVLSTEKCRINSMDFIGLQALAKKLNEECKNFNG
jgi:hypothetical protein